MPAQVTLDEFLAKSTPAIRDLTVRARELVLSVAPHAVEKVWPGWKVIGFGTDGTMAGMVCGVSPLKEAVSIALARGEEIPDPANLLAGAGKSYGQLKLKTRAELERPEVRAILEAAFALGGDPNLMKRKGKGAAADASSPPMSDDAVRAKTGKGWDEWFALLDAAGGAGRDHKGIVALLAGAGAGSWWQQMLAVGYERARGLREKHQTPDGYQVGGSKTVGVPVERLYEAWTDAKLRTKWLGKEKLAVRKATEPKSLRITWGDGSALDVLFYPKGEAKSSVQIDQRKLPDRAAIDRQKAFWKERLARLKEVLEG